jgi:cell wall-associated NlpC family hydrolase
MWSLYSSYIIGETNTTPIDILGKCNNLQWTNDSDTLAVSLSFDSILDLAEGRSHIILKKDDKAVFSGIVVSKTNKDKTSSYTVMDYSMYLNRNEISVIQFNNANAKQALEQLCNKYNIPHAIIPLNTRINKIYKGKVVSDIINDILELCKNEIGEEVVKEMRGNVLWIDKVSNLKVTCKYKVGNDFSITRSIEDMVNYVDVITNEEEDKSSYAHAYDDSSIKIFGMLSKVISIDKANVSQAQNIADKYLVNYNATKKELTVTLLDVEGCEEIRAKRMIPISITKYGVDGYYKVKSAQHNLSNNMHKINVTIDFSGVSFKDPVELTNANSSDAKKANKHGEIIEYAKKFLGVQYVLGGKTPDGFDCSGFVSYVFKNFGYSLTPYTYDMINEGTQVSLSEIQECDLVFFFNTDHVGIYIGGDQFIHAPHAGDVVKISQFSGYYEDNCNSVVRVTGEG